MAVAKSYENYKLSEPFAENGKNYVTATCSCDHCGGSGIWYGGQYSGTCFKCGGSGRITAKVRWYTDAERARMDIAAAKRAEAASEKHKAKMLYLQGPEYNHFGSQEGYITLLLGDTYSIKEQLKAEGCRYSNLFGWYVPHNIEYSRTDIETYRLYWEQISENGIMLNESVVKDIVIDSTRKPSLSAFVGEVGEKINFVAKVITNRTFETRFGTSRAIIFETDEHNLFVWYTSARDPAVGTVYSVSGTIKDHSEYDGKKQTVMTRCKIKEA